LFPKTWKEIFIWKAMSIYYSQGGVAISSIFCHIGFG